MGSNQTPTEDADTVEYTVELSGGPYVHEQFREEIHEHGGEITSEQSLSENNTTAEDVIDEAVEYAQEAITNGELSESQAANEAAMDAIQGLSVTGNDNEPTVLELLNTLAKMGVLAADDITEHTKRFTWSNPTSHEHSEAVIKALTYRSLEEYIYGTY